MHHTNIRKNLVKGYIETPCTIFVNFWGNLIFSKIKILSKNFKSSLKKYDRNKRDHIFSKYFLGGEMWGA